MGPTCRSATVTESHHAAAESSTATAAAHSESTAAVVFEKRTTAPKSAGTSIVFKERTFISCADIETGASMETGLGELEAWQLPPRLWAEPGFLREVSICSCHSRV